MKKLTEFIEEERKRYVDEDNNRFAFSLYKVTDYWWFLLTIYERYENLSNQWHENRKQIMAYTESQNNDNGAKVFALFNESNEIEMGIRLKIESFYLFAKTLLDKLANSVWAYFGKVHKKGCTLSSHDALENHFLEYSKLKKIVLPDETLLELAKSLRKEISDFRDWQISHERNPERGLMSSRMTILDEGGYLKLRVIRFLKSQKIEETSSGRMEELLSIINIYSDKIIEMIKANSEKSNFKIKSTTL